MIKAIETRYAGCRFRSRLEARWAVFFDTLDIDWEYEPQGFESDQGSYLPDFYLPSVFRPSRNWCHASEHIATRCAECGGPELRGLYVEVKGSTKTVSEADRTRMGVLIDFGGPLSDGLLLLGPIPIPQAHYIGHQVARNVKGVALAESTWVWTGAGARLIETSTSYGDILSDEIPPSARWEADVVTGDSLQPEVSRAYSAAKSARFEHGECG